MKFYRELAQLMHATEVKPLCIDSVEFWIDTVGPWAGQLSFSVPTGQWNPLAMGKDVALLAATNPEIGLIAMKYAN
jgi:hypothetical protein